MYTYMCMCICICIYLYTLDDVIVTRADGWAGGRACVQTNGIIQSCLRGLTRGAIIATSRVHTYIYMYIYLCRSLHSF